MFTPSMQDIFPTPPTSHPVSTALLRSLASTNADAVLYLDSSDTWTTTKPSPSALAFRLSPETRRLLLDAVAPSSPSEVWDVGGTTYRLVAVTAADGARHGVAVMVGPGTPPPV